jgi:hypothetical protein
VTDTNVFQLSQPGTFADRLAEILRDGARALLAQAVEAEVWALLSRHADEVTDDGRQRLVRHGHLPEREIMIGIGAVAVRCPRERDRVGKGSERIRFSSAILPPYARRSKSSRPRPSPGLRTLGLTSTRPGANTISPCVLLDRRHPRAGQARGRRAVPAGRYRCHTRGQEGACRPDRRRARKCTILEGAPPCALSYLTPQLSTKASNAARSSFLVSAIQISCSGRLAFDCWLFGSLLRMLAVLWTQPTQQRWPRVFGHTSSIACQKPSAPSATASSGAIESPRRFRSSTVSFSAPSQRIAGPTGAA